MDAAEFQEAYSPRFGDVVFTREPTKSSWRVRIGQAIRECVRGKLATVHYSHAAFVVDCNRIVHARGGSGVQPIYLQDFFTDGMEYRVLRPSQVGGVNETNATYYVGQGYDSPEDFLRRFLLSYEPRSTQVCSTLVARMLVNFELAEIRNPEALSPLELHECLVGLGWQDVSEKYRDFLGFSIGQDEHLEFLRHAYRVLDADVASTRQTKKEVAALKQVLLRGNAVWMRWALLSNDKELQTHLEKERHSLESLEDIDVAFFDTDEEARHVFRK
jgi:hypothetical protein